MLFEDAFGDIATQADLAVDDDLAVARQLAEALAQLAQRDHPGLRDNAQVGLGRLAYVEQQCVLGQSVGIDRIAVAAQQVHGHHAGDVDRRLGRAVGRRIGELELGQVVDGHASLHRRGQHVDLLLDIPAADDLGAQQGAIVAAQHLHVQNLRPGVVGGVGQGVDVDPAERGLGGGQRRGSPADTRCGHAEDLHHARPQRTAVAAVAATDVLGRDAALAIGRPGQRDQGRLTAHTVGDRDRVAHREDAGIAAAQMVIHGDAAPGAEVQAGGGRQLAVRAYSHGHDHQVRLQAFAALQHDGERAVRRRPLDRGGGLAQVQHNALAGQLLVQRFRHLGVQGAQDVRQNVDQMHLEATRPEVLRHLDADEPGADDRGPAYALLQARQDAVHVPQRPEGVHPGTVCARDRRHHRPRPRGQDQRVVTLFIDLAGLGLPHGHGLAITLNRGHLLPRPYLDVEARPEALRRHHQQALALRNHPTEMVGQAAVGEGDELPTLHHHDLGFLIQPPCPCRRTRPARHPTDDHQFHRACLHRM